MQVLESTVTSKFQLTLPKKLRRLLNIGVGDKVSFLVEDKKAVFIPKPSSVVEALAKLSKGKRFAGIRAEVRAARKEW